MIRAENVVKKFGDFKALDGMSLHAEKGKKKRESTQETAAVHGKKSSCRKWKAKNRPPPAS